MWAVVVAAGVAIAVAGLGSAESSRTYVVWAVGDAADGGEGGRAVAAMIGARTPDRLLYLGDVYETGTRKEFERNYHPLFGDLGAITLPTPGNHEWPNHVQGYDAYWAAVRGRPMPDRYVRRLGAWKLVSVNSEVSLARGSAQLAWVDRQLAGGGTCRIVFLHRARFSASDPHGDEPRLQPLWATVAGRAAILLSGHHHNMQRFKPVNGLVQLISGAGGRRRYDVDEGDERLAFSEDRVFGALRLVLEPGRARLSFVAAGGRVLDRSTVGCKP